jgi:4-oxalocrotonate tautomerase
MASPPLLKESLIPYSKKDKDHPVPVKGEITMPILQVHLLQGRTTEQKRRLVQEVTEAVCRSLDVKADQVRIILSEMDREDYAVGGTLMADKQ